MPQDRPAVLDVPFLEVDALLPSFLITKKKKKKKQSSISSLWACLLLAWNHGAGFPPVGSVHGGDEERSRGLQYGSKATYELNLGKLGRGLLSRFVSTGFTADKLVLNELNQALLS